MDEDEGRVRFEDLPGADEYLERRQQMLARHAKERSDLSERHMEEDQRLTEEFQARLARAEGTS